MKVVSPDDASNLSNLLKDGDWMVLYYAEWCGHCKTMKPEWEKVVSKLKDTGKVNVAEIESDLVGHLKDKPQIEGYPTIKMYNGGKEVAKFGNEERVADNIEKFAMSNSKSSNSKASNNNKKAVNTKLVENKLEKMIEEKLENKLEAKLEDKLEAKLEDKLEELKPTASELPMVPITNLQQSHLSEKEIIHNSHLYKQPTIKERSVKHSSKHSSKKLHPASVKHIINNKLKSNRKASGIKTPVKELKLDDLFAIQENNVPKKSVKKTVVKKLSVPKPRENLSCNEINKAKACKSNPKCMYDYTEYKCKDKLLTTIPKLNNQKPKSLKPKSHKSKSHKSKSHKSKAISKKGSKNNLRTSTKQVFGELIKSFGRIGNEAKKDSKILRNASTKL